MRRTAHGGRRTADGRRRTAFTLLELLVVLLVLGLLAGLVAPQIIGRVGEARTTTAKTQVALLSTALDSYRLDNADYPTTAQGLAALMDKPAAAPVPAHWRGPYLRKEIPLDPWGRPYIYQYPGTRGTGSFALFSLGRDGKEGGADEDADIR